MPVYHIDFGQTMLNLYGSNVFIKVIKSRIVVEICGRLALLEDNHITTEFSDTHDECK